MTIKKESIPMNTSLPQKLMREPMVHFFVIALIIFAAYAIAQSGNENHLEIDQREIDARIFMQELSRGEELSLEQRELVTALYIEEQILVREALSMELDNDERIHDVLAQKMRHVLSGSIIQPTDDELQEYYEENSSRFETPASLTLDELVFDSRDALADSIVDSLRQNADTDTLLSMSQGTVAPLPNVNSLDLANIFDQEFADRILAADLDQWEGPYVSNRGQHWLRIVERRPTNIPALEEIADLVRLEWITAEEETRLQQEVDKLWDEYTIVISNVEPD
ncbi:MAG: peptidyl-prolyl cis-trans isomerase [Gammaproteobacteria bacterium]|nr:peptidyl-prolyl cis-trans isomerase [Gammaproteobacteria bacterium]